ncbi:MAG TPA: hypothetical protein VGE24_16780 [Emticicia sp.]
MALGKQILNKWNNQQVDSNEPKSDFYGFSRPIYGVDFKNHPFKITEINSTAPILRSANQFGDFSENQEFTLTLNIEPGFVYDIGRYENDPYIPLYVAKRQDSRFCFIRKKEREFLTEESMDYMKIEVDIDNPIELKIRTVNGASETFGNDGMGLLFFVITFSDVSTLQKNQSSVIQSAAILTAEQILKLYPDATFLGETVIFPYQNRNTVRAFVFYSSRFSHYMCLNSARETAVKAFPEVSSYSEEYKQQLLNDNVGGQFSFAFVSWPWEPALKNHLFLRIFS